MNLFFHKYQGTGNDFIIIDNRANIVPLLTVNDVRFLCDRHFGIGADGVIIINNKEGFDFEMIYYNADGNKGTMCGNGARCSVKYVYKNGIQQGVYNFWASDGAHTAAIDNLENVRLKMSDVQNVVKHSADYIINTGSPHYVTFVNKIEDIDVATAGKAIRYSSTFNEVGINVNFVQTLNKETIWVRTYERGVENETLSCGTGVTAASLLQPSNKVGFNSVKVKTLGGILNVEYNKKSNSHFTDIWLVGPASFIFNGEIKI